MSQVTFQIDAPFVTFEEYSRRTGTSIASIRAQVRQGRLPIKPKKSRSETPFINMLALAREASEQQFSL